jgi:hypothetical protein
MKSILAIAILALSLFLAGPTNAYIPVVDADSIPAITGIITGNPLACEADQLDTEAKATLNRWRELNAKRDAGTITEEELLEGSKLAAHPELDPNTGQVVLVGRCGVLPNGLPVTVKQLDGVDYFVLAPDGHSTFIVKSDGFVRD